MRMIDCSRWMWIGSKASHPLSMSVKMMKLAKSRLAVGTWWTAWAGCWVTGVLSGSGTHTASTSSLLQLFLLLYTIKRTRIKPQWQSKARSATHRSLQLHPFALSVWPQTALPEPRCHVAPDAIYVSG